MSPQVRNPVVLSLGSNLGDRRKHLRSAIARLARAVRVVRLSSLYASAPVDAPPGSPEFLNLVALVMTPRRPSELLHALLIIEEELGRRRRVRNEPRVIDLDLILFGALVLRTPELTLPHPRYRRRNFVVEPLRELRLNWSDPQTGIPLSELRGEGLVRRIGSLY